MFLQSISIFKHSFVKYSKGIEKGQQDKQQKEEILQWFWMYCFVVHRCHSPFAKF
jgi:hypothetical protein